MNRLFSISNILKFCFLFSHISCTSLLEKLLESHIKEAQCEARCQTQENLEDVKMCVDVCKIVVGRPGSTRSPICQLPHICSGACQTACQNEGIKTERIVSISQEDCQLSWSLESGVSNDLVFIISGVDLGGKINLISSRVKETNLKMTSLMTKKYLEMTVIAVGSQGVLDIQSSIIETKNKCEKMSDGYIVDKNKIETENISSEIETQADGVTVKKIINNKNFLNIFIYSLIATSFLVVIGIVCCVPRKPEFHKLKNIPELV